MNWKLIIIVLRISLGALFIYGGIQKFIPKAPRPSSVQVEELPEHVVKIKAFIGGMKKTDYFWSFLGIAEIICGLLLISQKFALLGAVMLVPITLNIFLFHLFLEPHERGELALTCLYLLINLSLISYHYKLLKPVFITQKLI